MKKTLLTLAAFAMVSVAQAATIDDAVVNVADPGSRVDAGTTSDSYTWIAVMDWDTAVAKLGNYASRSHIYATDNWNTWAAQGVAISRDENNTTNDSLYSMFSEHANQVNWANKATSYTGLTLSSDGANFLFDRATYENNGKLTLSFSYDDTTKVYTFSALKADGTLGIATIDKSATEGGWNPSPYGGADLKGKSTDVIEHFMYFTSALSSNDVAAIAAAAVPEPATATLSLLALAGLAARRRRK